jgi:2-dehydro-3-deoxy-L-rhamnonate dehydrogenase (NAD+)
VEPRTSINLNGVFYANRAAVRKMKPAGLRADRQHRVHRGQGRESDGSRLLRELGKDVAGSGVLVNCVAPAAIDTPLVGQSTEEHMPT